MANALRNLQLFRNGTPIVGTMTYAKTTIENAFAAGTLVLSDGEPISIRYQETVNDDVKGLYGIAYVNGADKQILWADSNIQVLPPQGQSDYIYVTEGTDGSFTVSANVVNVNAATGAADGLASAYDVQQYVTEYVTETVKDKFVKSGTVEYLGEDSEHRMPGAAGYVETPGDDPYLVLVLEGGEPGTTDDTKIYIEVSSMVPGEDTIKGWANTVAGERIANLGSVTATGGNYFTEIRVNAVTGQLEAEEALLPSGGSGDYYEGHDIDFRIVEDPQTQENNTFIDTALDADIRVAGLTAAIGGVGINDTFTQGMSLSDVLRKIFVKDVDVKATAPDATFNMSDSTATYEYGSSVTKTLSVSGFKDGYYSPANSAYPVETFNTNNETTGGKKNAGCTQGSESFSASTGSVSGSTWTNGNLTGSTTLTATIPYTASNVTPKTMANNDSSVTIPADNIVKTKTITAKHVLYAGVIDGTDFSSSDFATVSTAISASSNKYNGAWYDGTGYYRAGATQPTTATSKTEGKYFVDRGKSLVVIVPHGKDVTVQNTFEVDFTLTGITVTRTVPGTSNDVSYDIVWKANVSSDAAEELVNLHVQ